MTKPPGQVAIDLAQFHQRFQKPVLLADSCVSETLADGSKRHSPVGYRRLLETLRGVDGCVGLHLYGAGGFDKPAPLEPGRAVRLVVALGSTAVVFDRGHRIGVHVTSSSAPKFEVHPNTFVPVASYDAARVARNTVHVSSVQPSKLIVPRIVAGQGGNW